METKSWLFVVAIMNFRPPVAQSFVVIVAAPRPAVRRTTTSLSPVAAGRFDSDTAAAVGQDPCTDLFDPSSQKQCLQQGH